MKRIIFLLLICCLGNIAFAQNIQRKEVKAVIKSKQQLLERLKADDFPEDSEAMGEIQNLQKQISNLKKKGKKALKKEREENSGMLSLLIGFDRAPLLQLDPMNPAGTNMPYKMAIFVEDGTGISKSTNSLSYWIEKGSIPENQKQVFHEANRELQNIPQSSVYGDKESEVELDDFDVIRENYSLKKESFVKSDNNNFFNIPDIKNAKIILMGENHLYRYPSVAVVNKLIEYNKKAPKDQKITNLFLEFDNSVNIAYDFIKRNLYTMLEKDLLDEAVASAKIRLKNSAPQEQVKHWVYLAYLIAKNMPEVFVYAYDSNGSLDTRNSIAAAYIKALKSNPNAKAVFITGAGHIIKNNVDDSLALSHYDAGYAIPAKIKDIYSEGEVISINIIGGQEWPGGKAAFSHASIDDPRFEKLEYSAYIMEKAREKGWKDFVLKLDPQTEGFDYMMHFDQNADYK